MSQWTDLLQSVERAEPSPLVPARALARAAELGEQPAQRRARKAITLVAAGAACCLILAALMIAAHSREQTAPARPTPAPHPCVVGSPGCGSLPVLPIHDTPEPRGGRDRGAPHPGLLRPGAYTAVDWSHLGLNHAGFNLAFTVPDGWSWDGRTLSKGNAAVSFFTAPVVVYADPCHWERQVAPLGLAAHQDIMNALAAQPMRYATRPRYLPASVPASGGRNWDTWAIRLTVPSNLDVSHCDQGQYRTWGAGANTLVAHGPGQRDLIWETYLGPFAGPLIADAATFPSTPPRLVHQIDAILASIKAGQWG